jgi:NitT/TauT family transport system ATP-binding protein
MIESNFRGLAVDDVSFWYRPGQPIFDHLELAVPTGKRLGLVGPSGCGKSTLLALLAGNVSPQSGRIVRPESNVGSHPLTMVFQEDTLLPWLTVEKNVGLHFKLRGRARSAEVRQHVAELLDIAGLTSFAHAYPYQLSGGMKRRVQFLTAVAPMPTALLLDEPFSSLDEPTRVSIHQFVVDVAQKSQITMLLVTHDLAEAITLCDDVVILSNTPARAVSVRHVPFGANRDVYELRKTREFLDLYAELWDELSRQLRNSRRVSGGSLGGRVGPKELEASS